jgi:hypothetical protein
MTESLGIKEIFKSVNNVIINILLLLSTGIAIGIGISIFDLNGIIALLAVPIGVVILLGVLRHPDRTVYTVLILSFFVSGLSRYIDFPWGLAIDVLLVVAWVTLFITKFRKLQIQFLRNDLMLLSLLWMAYIIVEIINPASSSITAWFYAMRGVGLYHLLIFSLTLMLFRNPRYLDRFLQLIIGLSILGAIWAIKQKYIGLDSAEDYWLWVEGHYDEHILFGVLRAFSFYSDAGQFGASQAMVALICVILILQKKLSPYLRIFYFIGFLFTFIGFGLSGARGAMAIPALGGLVFLVLSKNFKILIIGLIVFASLFFALKYTHIGHNIEQVRRMRTALAPENPSLLARKRNQQIFAKHLKYLPMGGGIGSAEYWGKRFSPNTILAQTPTDSYYVKIWAETGIIGVSFHVMILGYIMGTCGVLIQRLKSISLRTKTTALYCAVFGVLAASYGNQVFSQMPTGVIMSISIGLMFLSPHYDKYIINNRA